MNVNVDEFEATKVIVEVADELRRRGAGRLAPAEFQQLARLVEDQVLARYGRTRAWLDANDAGNQAWGEA